MLALERTVKQQTNAGLNINDRYIIADTTCEKMLRIRQKPKNKNKKTQEFKTKARNIALYQVNHVQ